MTTSALIIIYDIANIFSIACLGCCGCGSYRVTPDSGVTRSLNIPLPRNRQRNGTRHALSKRKKEY